MRLRHYVIICFLICVGCYPVRHEDVHIIRIKGSDTMLLLTRLWAEEYAKDHPNISIYVDGGGTATGAEALAKGEVDICAASRPLRPEEISHLAKKYDKIGMAFLVAKDALSVYIHPENPVKSLSIPQLSNIFTGRLDNWGQVGGRDEPILIASRNPSSGTFFYFQEHVLDGQAYGEKALVFATTEQIAQFITQHINAIGYGGFGWGKNVAYCRVNDIEPTETNVIKGSYPISRYLYLYTVNVPRNDVKNFINWTMDRKNQHLIKKSGYFPIWNDPERDKPKFSK